LIRFERIDAQTLLARHRDEVAEVWSEAFPQEAGALEDRLEEILPRHASRDGFRFLGARTPDGTLAGFAYGYRGGAGEWWHDLVAEALGEEGSRRWLAPGHFEFVELQVRPDFQRRGIGGRLHDELLDGLDSPTAVLSTQVDNEAARALYEQRGWTLVLDSFQFQPQGPPFVVMGLDLDRPRRTRGE
jgi:ribosomal protein S18 acetylase RimI-like enzyme